MSAKLMMAFSMLFVICSMLCLFIEGSWVDDREMDVLNSLTGYSAVEAGSMSVISLGVGFFTSGLPKMLMWDYSFFDGGWGIVRIFLMPISIGIIWGVFTVVIGALQSLVSGILRLF